jgi:hypothetical protein
VNVTVNQANWIAANNFVLPHVAGCPHLYSNGAVYATAASSNAFWIEEGQAQAGINEVGPLYSFKLVLNGQDRFAAQGGKYFNQYQPFQYHSGVPYPGVYCYSFALKPEEHQPTGTCNFSRIDNAQVSVNLKSTRNQATLQKLFAINYNILRIQSGMGGLAFAN